MTALVPSVTNGGPPRDLRGVARFRRQRGAHESSSALALAPDPSCVTLTPAVRPTVMSPSRLALALALVAACRPSSAHESPPEELARPASPSAPPPAPPAPPPPHAPFEDLDIPPRPRPFVSAPSQRGARPVLVALHGMGDRPDWTCGAWREVIHASAWVVCPRGKVNTEWSTKDDTRYSLLEPMPELEAHIDAALAALSAKHPGEVDLDHPMLAGFSWGASQVAYLANRRNDGRYTRVAVVEGGYDAVLGSARALKGRGVARVLIGAGQKGNDAAGKHLRASLEREGVSARAGYAPVGHTFDVPLQKALAEHFAWWVEGDARFAALAPPPVPDN